MSKPLPRLNPPEAERFTEILRVWTVDLDESRPLDLSLRRKGWIVQGSTLTDCDGKPRIVYPVLEPVAESYRMEDDIPVPIFAKKSVRKTK